MDLPALSATLLELVKQFPVLALCGFVLWYAVRYQDAKHKREIESARTQHDGQLRMVQELMGKHVEDLKAQHAAHVESMQKEINRLVESQSEAVKERERLLRRLVPEPRKGET